MKRSVLLLLCGWMSCVGSWTHAEDSSSWPSWRGSDNRGYVAKGNVPDRFGPDQVVWKADLPGKGCSTPIQHAGKIILTAPVEGKDAVVCFDTQGKLQWQQVFGSENAGKHRNGSGCNASPVTDGQSIFVYFKSGTFAALDYQGKVLWKQDLVQQFGKDTLYWDHGTSPILTQNHVVMARMHEGESWLAAFHKKTGEIAWKVDRNYKTPQECDHGYSTPVVTQFAGQEAIVTWGAERVTVHSAAKGELLYECGNFNPEGSKLWPAIVTPILVGDMAVIAYGRNDRGVPKLFGVRLQGSGDTTASSHIWKRDDVGTFVPTPAVLGDKIVLVRDKGEVECLDPKTGKTVWNGAFPKGRSNFYSSPLIMGDKLYAPREDGMVYVAKITESNFEMVAENNLGEPIIGSPIPSGDRLLLRGEKHLFCIGNK